MPPSLWRVLFVQLTWTPICGLGTLSNRKQSRRGVSLSGKIGRHVVWNFGSADTLEPTWLAETTHSDVFVLQWLRCPEARWIRTQRQSSTAKAIWWLNQPALSHPNSYFAGGLLIVISSRQTSRFHFALVIFAPAKIWDPVRTFNSQRYTASPDSARTSFQVVLNY